MNVALRSLALLCQIFLLLLAGSLAVAQPPASSVTVTLKSGTAKTNSLNGRILGDRRRGCAAGRSWRTYVPAERVRNR